MRKHSTLVNILNIKTSKKQLIIIMLSKKLNAIVEKAILNKLKENLATKLKDHNLNSNNQKTDVTKRILDNPYHYIDLNKVSVFQL